MTPKPVTERAPTGADDEERLSLYGPPFEDVMAALLAVDPRKTDEDRGDNERTS